MVASMKNTRLGSGPKVLTCAPVHGIHGWSAPPRMRPLMAARNPMTWGRPTVPAART